MNGRLEWRIVEARHDGAGAMAGRIKGVSSRILSVYPKALYTHCTSHILNLCVVKSLDLRNVKNMMGLADSIARFFKNSPKQPWKWLSMMQVVMTVQGVRN